ncbi:hypothetical protein [Halomicrobium urmianum]|uniref:hypothetical protein n=1 Tax=Halomicrobium urmianum TaxID=1586233 RepID=UPI001CDA2832|nr:hypothetical protein [Halomicrobium urmianum]
MITDPSELDDLLPRIMSDYNARQRFFADHRLPEYEVLEELELEGRNLALFLTLTCVTNHIHNESGESKKTDGTDGLWHVCADLYQRHQWVYHPEQLVDDDRRDELDELFQSLDLMNSRDPDWWYRNAKALYEYWDSDPRDLLSEPNASSATTTTGSFDAPAIEQAVEANDFPALSGEKIRPLWLRLMHEEVHELERIEEVHIPVDYHIVGMTNRLRGDESTFDPYEEADRETLRRFWHLVCQRNGLVPVQVDKPLWLLNKYWDNGGRVYVAETLREIRSN